MDWSRSGCPSRSAADRKRAGCRAVPVSLSTPDWLPSRASVLYAWATCTRCTSPPSKSNVSGLAVLSSASPSAAAVAQTWREPSSTSRSARGARYWLASASRRRTGPRHAAGVYRSCMPSGRVAGISQTSEAGPMPRANPASATNGVRMEPGWRTAVGCVSAYASTCPEVGSSRIAAPASPSLRTGSNGRVVSRRAASHSCGAAVVDWSRASCACNVQVTWRCRSISSVVMISSPPRSTCCVPSALVSCATTRLVNAGAGGLAGWRAMRRSSVSARACS